MHEHSMDRRSLLKGAAVGAGLIAVGGAVAPPAHAANWKVLPFTYQAQVTGYWCGPTATAIALSCRGISVTQQQMADELGTTTDGTDSITQVTAVLDNHVGWYETKQIPNDPPTQAQKDLLWHDITYNVDHGYAVVANIWAPANNHPPGYPNELIMHYFTVVGYNPDTMQAYIADPANFQGNSEYWLTFDQLASLIPPKGYSA